MIIRAVLLTFVLAATAAGAQAAEQDHWAVRGLDRPARLIIDHWGVPHIFAASERDAFFLQGYNAARDRLWQIDLWRKRGLGLLSASFGPAYVAQDRAARLFLYRGDMGAEWAAYAPSARSAVEAFTAGVNAYVDEVKRGVKPLPVEFGLTGSSPEIWRPEDVVRIRSHALISNLTSEVARSQVACAAGVEADALRRKLEPPHALAIPTGLDPCAVTPDVLSDYVLGTKPVAFSRETKKVATVELAALEATEAAEGSNNWVVAPSRTATGRPLLANDPHRPLGTPSLRYVVQLSAPGLSIVGAGEPAAPGVSLGHNDKAAFGITIFPIDQQDLYVYALNPANLDQYRYGDGWEKMTVLRETVPVKGEAAREIELRFTRHGPVLDYDPAHARAFALRSVWAEPGASAYFQSSWLWHARAWGDFVAAHDHWGAPALNLVWADTAGNIGWAGSGSTPIRPNWDGLMPVPGDGRYEWRGFLGGGDLPSILNPAKGWFATANAMNLPAGYPDEARKVSFEWNDRSRLTRIEEVLAADAKVSVADCMALQTDTHNANARRLLALLAPLSSPDPRTARALALLKAWDADERADSAAAAIFEVWALKHLGKGVVERVTPPAAQGAVGWGSLDAVIGYVEHPDARLGADPAAARDRLLLATLRPALDELDAALGPDMAKWSWGRLHHATFTPAIAAIADPPLAARLTLGPIPLPGGAWTPRAATWDLATFNTLSGASVRMVIDVGAWDNSKVVNTPGESGDPASPHYGDLFPIWASGGYLPLLYSKAAVEAAAERVIELAPASGGKE